MILETLEDFQKAVKSGKKINVETKTIFFINDDEEEKKKETFKVGEPYYVDGKVVGVVACVTLDGDEMEILVTALEDLVKDINWSNACEKCESLEHGFSMPNKSDICLIAANMEKINAGLKKHGKPFKDDAYYWSSSEYSDYHAWLFCTHNSGGVDYNNKGYYGSEYVVRPVLKISKTI